MVVIEFVRFGGHRFSDDALCKSKVRAVNFVTFARWT